MEKTDFVVDREKLEVRMMKIFDAPRNLVWKAHTDPTLIPEWWGPRNTITRVEKMDVKDGGEWRFISIDENGEVAFYGKYKELREPESITWAFNYEPIGLGHELTETVKFEEVEGSPEQSRRTKISTVSHHNTLEDLEEMVNSGMEKGAIETWDRLSELLEKMKKGEK